MVTDLSLSTDHFQKFIQKNHLISYCHAKFGRSMKPLEKAMNYKKNVKAKKRYSKGWSE